MATIHSRVRRCRCFVRGSQTEIPGAPRARVLALLLQLHVWSLSDLSLGPDGLRIGAVRSLIGPRSSRAPPPPPLPLREVPQKLARERRGLSRHPVARATQHLLRLRSVGERRCKQCRGQAPVVLARGLNQSPCVAAMGRARRVDQQAEQALGLGPALNRVLLVRLARVLGKPPDPCLRLISPPDPALGEGLKQRTSTFPSLLARPGAD